MRLKPEQITILQEDLCAELVEILMNEWHYSMQESLSILYNSDTFTLIQDVGTGLYFQSAGYGYTFLEEELKKGKVAWPDNMAAGPASYGMTDTLGRMHSDAQ